VVDRPHVPIPHVGTVEHEREQEEMRRMEERVRDRSIICRRCDP
jgi:hypothetical protein